MMTRELVITKKGSLVFGTLGGHRHKGLPMQQKALTSQLAHLPPA